MLEIISLCSGVLFFSVVFYLINRFEKSRIQDPRSRNFVASPSIGGTSPSIGGTKHSLYASCAADMELQFQELCFTNAQVRIIGGDGTYFLLKNSKKLICLLSSMLSKNAKIEYILINPTERAEKFIVEKFIADEALFKSENITFYKYDADKADKAEVKDIAEIMKTEHPTLIKTADKGNALWLEGNHPSESMFAYEITYVPPEGMTGECKEMFDKYDKQTSLLLASCIKVEVKVENSGQLAA